MFNAFHQDHNATDEICTGLLRNTFRTNLWNWKTIECNNFHNRVNVLFQKWKLELEHAWIFVFNNSRIIEITTKWNIHSKKWLIQKLHYLTFNTVLLVFWSAK